MNAATAPNATANPRVSTVVHAGSAAHNGAECSPSVHLLVVDDDLSTIECLGWLLKDFAQISFATSGEEAMRMARQRRPDLVLLDRQLPDLGGMEICRQLRTEPGLRDVPIVMTTGQADADTEAQALREGADDFIRKPFNAPVLRARVRRLIDSRATTPPEPSFAQSQQNDNVHALDRTAASKHQPSDDDATRATAAMLSYVAHEVGNPVNIIKGFAQLMQADLKAPLTSGQAEKLAHILDAANHLGALLSDVGDLARMESGRFAVDLRAVDVCALAGLACQQAMAQAAASSIRISAPRPAPPKYAHADARRLRQCLDNLLSNAIKYGNPGDAVEVEIQAHDGHVTLAVQDHGNGLNAAQLAQLFEPYNRLGQENSHVPGSGLGLVLTRDLVQAMGGELRVRSESGQGCRFEMRLQASAPPDNPY